MPLDIIVVYFSTCSLGTWDCGDHECHTSVQCPNNQIYRKKFQRCGTQCTTYAKKDLCDPNERYVDGCACDEATVLNQTVCHGCY